MQREVPGGDPEEVRRLRIAIDGPAGAGKSTVARRLAQKLGCAFVDTGLMYRAVTLKALAAGIPVTDGPALLEVAGLLTFSLSGPERNVLLIDSAPASPVLHSAVIDANVSEVSAHPEVRDVMVLRQRELAGTGCVVMVGRDIGTTVLPDAEIKLWVTASPAERARRRANERGTGDGSDLEEILARDAIDSGRAASPLRRARDAITIDTEGLTEDQAERRALATVEAVVERHGFSVRAPTSLPPA